MNWEEFVRWTLESLVRIPSSADEGVDAILVAAVDRLKYLGFEPLVHGDVKAVSATSGEGGVLFNGHLDTVPVAAGWTRQQGTWDGDFLYGRGTADMKAGCAAALAAAAALSESNVPCSLLFTTDEETTMAAPKKLASTELVTKAAAVIVGEPTGLRVIHQEKGVLWYRATAHGRSAHGSLPHTGDSAIHRMARGLGRLEAYTRPKDVFAEITVNAGRIQGGVAPNVVADACWADLDCRHPPGTTKADVEAVLRGAFQEPGSPVDLSLMHEVPPALVLPNAAHVRILRELAGTDLGGVTYGTEMAWYAAKNPRCAVFGPGDPQRIHVPDERVSLSETVRAARILTEFGTRLAGRG